MSTVNERAARRWEQERDRRIMAAWNRIVAKVREASAERWIRDDLRKEIR